MATLSKMFLMIVCINIFLYIGLNYGMEQGARYNNSIYIQGDLFSVLLENKDKTFNGIADNLNAMKGGEETSNAYYLNLTSDYTQPPSEQSGLSADTDTSGFSIIDVARMAIPFIKTLFNMALSPFTLLSQGGIPPLISLVIGLPIISIYLIMLIVFIRGGGAS